MEGTNRKETAKFIDYERGGRQKKVYTETDIEFVFCPLCGRNEYKEIYRERGVLGIVRCLKCSLIYVNPRLKNPEEVYWGDADKYFKEAKLIFEGKARHHRDSNYIADLKLIYKYKPSGNLLDIGTNMGFFIRNARGKKWNLYGVEPSASLSELARRHFELNVKTCFLEDSNFDSNFFDVITMTDVFEHITEPGKILNEVHRILKKDGILFIKVPNGLFNISKLYLAKAIRRLTEYDIFDSYEHVINYSYGTIKSMLEKYDFKILKTSVGRPIQIPVWHSYVGYYYQYATPWCLDFKRKTARNIFYILSLVEFMLRLNRVGYLAPNIITISKKCS